MHGCLFLGLTGTAQREQRPDKKLLPVLYGYAFNCFVNPLVIVSRTPLLNLAGDLDAEALAFRPVVFADLPVWPVRVEDGAEDLFASLSDLVEEFDPAGGNFFLQFGKVLE